MKKWKEKKKFDKNMKIGWLCRKIITKIKLKIFKKKLIYYKTMKKLKI
jgi:hypothetical protein